MRRGRRSSAAGSWMDQFGAQPWPIVTKTTLPVYRPRLAKRNPDQPGHPQPDDIRRILATTPDPALD